MPRLPVTDEQKLGELVVQCWTDPEVRLQLLKHPEETLAAHGVDIDPTKVRVVVHEDTDTTVHIVLPKRRVDPKDIRNDYIQYLGTVLLGGCRASSSKSEPLKVAAE